MLYFSSSPGCAIMNAVGGAPGLACNGLLPHTGQSAYQLHRMGVENMQETWTDHLGTHHRVIPLGKINRSSTQAVLLLDHLIRRNGCTCKHCGDAGIPGYGAGNIEKPVLEIDHIVPWRDGGSNHPDNLQLLCPACNTRKTRWERLWRANGQKGTPNDYRGWVKRWVPEGYADCTFLPDAWPLAGQGGVLNA